MNLKEKEVFMFENLKQTFDKGIEFAFATTEKVEKAAREFAKENNLNKEEAKKLIDSWIKKSEEIKKALEKQIAELQKTTIAKMNLVTMEDYKVLETRIKKLESKGRQPVKDAIKVKSARKVTPKKPIR